MSDPIIRGPKIPLAWSTVKATGYVVEKFDEDQKVDEVLIEDEDSQYVTEVTGLRRHSEMSLEVMPLSSVGTPPVAGEVFSYGASPDTKKFSVSSIKVARSKGQAVKWTLAGKFLPLVHT